MSQTKVKEVLEQLAKLFENPDELSGAMAATFIRRQGDRPIDRWSWRNRLLAWLEGTEDARTFNQWKKVGRSIKKGSHAFYILAPCTVKVAKKVEGEDGDEEEEEITWSRLVGFKAVPVFKIEDTEGDPIPEVPAPPLPPLHEVAERFGVPVRFAPYDGQELGHFSLTKKEIVLRVENAPVFFHELVHAAEARYRAVVPGQDADQETVAEIGAAVLARMYDQPIDKRAWRYVHMYHDDPASAVRRLLPRIEKALNLILDANAVEVKA